MAISHALVIPFCAQGHIAPLMEFSHHLADHGVLVTFVYTEHMHRLVMAGLPENFCSDYAERIRLVTIPDGLATDEERNSKALATIIPEIFPSFIEELILKINEKDEHKITFVIADGIMGFLLEVAKKLNLPRAAVWPASSWTLAVVLSIQKLIDDGVIDQNGFQTGDTLVQLSEAVPAFKSDHLCWVHFGDTKLEQEMLFKYFQKCAKSMKGLSHILCNTFEELESSFLDLINNAIPIGPLLPANKFKHQPSSVWAEDFSCIDWLDQQPTSSVIYVSLGSTTVLSQCQLGELALGLELTDCPFLWVCRPDITGHSVVAYPEGFMDRVASRSCIVKWAPQKEVLSHPSVACFFTHCGWNSAMEAVSNGVPMLCWPYFGDQFINQTMIVEVWKVGFQLANEDNRVVGKEEIKEKLKLVVNDKGMRERAMNWKEKGLKAVMKGGTSAKNFEGFVHIIKNMY